MKKALSLFLALTFVFVMFASVSVHATVLTEEKTATVAIKRNDNKKEVAVLTATDTYYYNNGYECVKVTDNVTYTDEYGSNLKNLPVMSSVVFIYSDYEIPTTKQANSYVATSSNVTVTSYVYSTSQYTVAAVYVYHKLNQGDSAVAAYTGEMTYNAFNVD